MSKIGTFTSILKGIGLAAADAGLSYVGLGEIAQKYIAPRETPPPGVVPQKLQDIWDLVKRNEIVIATLKNASLTNDQKRAMIVPEVTGMVMAIDDFRGHTPEDPEAFQQNLDKLIDAIVGIGNSFKKK
jgi:hypothetical protein